MKRIWIVGAIVGVLPLAGCGDDAVDAPDPLPSRYALVANGGSGTLSVIDLDAWTVERTISMDSDFHPHHLALAPDGSRALVAAPSTDLSAGHGGAGGHGTTDTRTRIVAIDTSNGATTAVAAVDATVHNATFTNDGGTIVFAMAEHGMLQALEASSFDETWSVSGLSTPLEVTATSDPDVLLVASSGSGNVAVVHVDERAVAAEIPVGETPIAVWRTGGGYYTSLEGARRVVPLTIDPPEPTEPSLDSDGIPGQVISVRQDSEVWVAVEDRGVVAVFDASTGTVSAEISVGGKPHALASDASGDRVLVGDEAASRVIVVAVESRAIEREIAVGEKPNGILVVRRRD